MTERRSPWTGPSQWAISQARSFYVRLNDAQKSPPVLMGMQNSHNGHAPVVRQIEQQEVFEVFYRPLPYAPKACVIRDEWRSNLRLAKQQFASGFYLG